VTVGLADRTQLAPLLEVAATPTSWGVDPGPTADLVAAGLFVALERGVAV